MNTQEMMNIALDLAKLKEETLDAQICCHGENIKRVLCGIDMDGSALLAAKMNGYDCVVEHHGINSKCVDIGTLMAHDQTMRMHEFGVPINVAQKAIEKKAKEQTDGFHSKNLGNKGDLARFIPMPYIGLHTPADMIGQAILQAHLDEMSKNKPLARVQDVIDSIMEISEFQHALQRPVVRVGTADSYSGRICVIFAGCTGGGPDVYKAYMDAGVGTLVLMHIGEADVKALNEHNKGNVIVAGHMASDSLGFNKILNAWAAKGIEITRIGGVVE